MGGQRLAGKVVLITGTGSGQGRAAALRFVAEGATVLGCDVDREGSDRTAELVRAAGGRISSWAPVDLCDRDHAERWVDDAAAEAGGIDVLYNNAGAVRFGRIAELEAEDWSFTLRNELELAVWTTQGAWPHLIARGGGAIVSIASTVAMRPHAEVGLAAHAAANAGLLAFTRQAAAEGAAHGIRVNSISPGGIETPALAAALLPEVPQPLGRIGQPEDVVQCASYLASEEASWVTGANVVVDGGMSTIDGVEPTTQ